MPDAPDPRGRGQWLLLAGLAAMFAASVVLPETPMVHVVVCPLRAATGLPCPGCGMGRAFCAVSRGELAAAFAHHALGPVVYVALALLMLRTLAEVVLRRRLAPLTPRRLRRPLVLALGVLLVALWLGRLAGILPPA